MYKLRKLRTVVATKKILIELDAKKHRQLATWKLYLDMTWEELLVDFLLELLNSENDEEYRTRITKTKEAMVGNGWYK